MRQVIQQFALLVCLTIVSVQSWQSWCQMERLIPFPERREFELSYIGRIPEITAGAKEVRIWVPLGNTRDGQKVLSRKIETELPYEIEKDPIFGNDLLYISLQAPLPPQIHLKVKYHVITDQREYQSRKNVSTLQKYLQPSILMVINDDVRQRSKIATGGRRQLAEKARGVYDYVLAHMKYDKTIPGWGKGDTLRACQVGAGNCTDFHSLFISMALAAEIPSRFKIGVTIPEQSEEGEIPGYHCWAEFYENGEGWKPVDASEAWKHPEKKEDYFGNFDPNKFMISVGRDIELVPKQKGGPINILFYPYIEVDGQPQNGIKVSLYYKNINV